MQRQVRCESPIREPARLLRRSRLGDVTPYDEDAALCQATSTLGTLVTDYQCVRSGAWMIIVRIALGDDTLTLSADIARRDERGGPSVLPVIRPAGSARTPTSGRKRAAGALGGRRVTSG